MKLLFDENLSPKLSILLRDLFPGSAHLRECGLKGCPDQIVWQFARENDFIIVSKDSDFRERSLLYGNPPKVVWLRIGNCSRQDLVQTITFHQQAIQDLAADPLEAMLVLSPAGYFMNSKRSDQPPA